jgi:hypothetical protein
MNREENNQWHLSKSVPVTFILAIVAQTVALIWFVATLRNDVDVNRQSIGRNLSGIEQNKEQISQLRVVVQSQAVTLARIDENIKAIRSAVEEFRKQD